MKVGELSSVVLKNLHGRGHSDEEIERMTANCIFDEVVAWNLGNGWGEELRGLMANIEDATGQRITALQQNAASDALRA